MAKEKHGIKGNLLDYVVYGLKHTTTIMSLLKLYIIYIELRYEMRWSHMREMRCELFWPGAEPTFVISCRYFLTLNSSLRFSGDVRHCERLTAVQWSAVPWPFVVNRSTKWGLVYKEKYKTKTMGPLRLHEAVPKRPNGTQLCTIVLEESNLDQEHVAQWNWCDSSSQLIGSIGSELVWTIYSKYAFQN